MALDMVDRLIIDTFLKLNPSFFDESLPPDTLTDLTRKQLFEGLVLLLWNCDPKTRSVVTSSKLPENMAARFRAAMNVVEAIKSVGVRDDIRYQTLLYGQAREIRNVLIGLIEKLPNETPMISVEESPVLSLIHRAVSNAVNDAVYPQITKYGFAGKRSWKSPAGCCRQYPFSGFAGNVSEAQRNGLEWQRSVLCACLEALHHQGHTSVSVETSQILKTVDNKNLRKYSPASSNVQLLSKPPVPPKKFALPLCNKEQTVDEVDKSLLRLNDAVEKLALLKAWIQEKTTLLMKKRESDAEKSLKLEELEDEAAKFDHRLIKLIESPEAVSAITEYVENTEKTEKRAQELQSRWISVKAEKEEQIREARKVYNAKVKGGSLATETTEIQNTTEELNAQLPQKRSKLKKLILKAGTINETNINRNLYTKWIFEMVATIKKQIDEAEKILAGNAQIQKEINSINGRLERTFTAIEERLYEEAQHHTLMQKAYRLLVKTYEECTLVINAIESSGKSEREIIELTDLIVDFKQKGLDDMLEKVLSDWTVVKEENKKFTELLNNA